MTDDSVMVELLARVIARARTGGNIYMDGSHNPRPTEYVTARHFLEPQDATVAEARTIIAALLPFAEDAADEEWFPMLERARKFLGDDG